MARTNSRCVGKRGRNLGTRRSWPGRFSPALLEPLEERIALATFMVAPTPDELVAEMVTAARE